MKRINMAFLALGLISAMVSCGQSSPSASSAKNISSLSELMVSDEEMSYLLPSAEVALVEKYSNYAGIIKINKKFSILYKSGDALNNLQKLTLINDVDAHFSISKNPLQKSLSVDSVPIINVKYSLKDLASYKKIVLDANLANLRIVGYDEKKNKLFIGFDNVISKQNAENKIINLGIPSDSFNLDIIGGLSHTMSTTDSVRPVIAGVAIYNNVNNYNGNKVGSCSIGPFVSSQDGKIKGFLTARHCLDTKGETITQYYSQTIGTTYALAPIVSNKSRDIGIVQVSASNIDPDTYAYEDADPGEDIAGSYSYTNSYTVNTNESPVQGDYVYAFGVRGQVTGEVDIKGASSSSPAIVDNSTGAHFTETNLTCNYMVDNNAEDEWNNLNGESGGIVTAYDDNGTAYATGVVANKYQDAGDYIFCYTDINSVGDTFNFKFYAY